MMPMVYSIPPKSRRVVEFGCGDGSLGAAFLQIQPECQYVGIDEDPAAAEIAGKRLTRVFCGNPESVDLKVQGISTVDCFVYPGRVLRMPGIQSVLKRHMEFLSAEGQMLFRVEHAGYIRHAMELLSGRKPAMTAAMSRQEAQEVISGAGMAVDRIQVLYDGQDAQWKEDEAIRQFIRSFAEFCQKNQLQIQTDIWAKGMIFRAVKKLPERKMMVQAMLGEALVTARIRLNEPNRFCMTIPGIETQAQQGSIRLVPPEAYPDRILIRQRVTMEEFENGLQQIRSITGQGYLLLYELDDSPSRWEAKHAQTGWLDFAGSHGVQVSTPALAEEVRVFNPEVRVFRNQLEYLPEKKETPREGEPVTIFFGALNREEDWTDIMPVINEAAAKYGEKLRFRVLADQQFFRALQTPHKEFIGQKDYYEGRYVPYPVYLQTLRSADIALLPLHDNKFNRSKSDLKFIESAAHGAAVLASPTVYQDSVEDGKTGFLYRSPEEFRQRLTLLLEDRPRRLEMIDAAYEYVKYNRLLSQHYEERVEWYRELLAKLPELNRSLQQRLAKLEENMRKR